jgi:hypothetical protein
LESQTGWVALLDVLGFSALMTRHTPGQKSALEGYLWAAERGCQGIEAVMFSDTILLTRPAGEKPEDDMLAMLRACAALMGWLLIAKIPVRGAIAYGSYFRHPRDGSVFVAGSPIVEAHYREESQEWLGITLCPSAIKEYHDRTGMALELELRLNAVADEEHVRELHARFPFARFLQPCNAIPTKDGRGGVEMVDGFAIVPVLTTPADDPGRFPALYMCRIILQKMRLEAPDARSQAKYERTASFLGAVEMSLNGARDLARKFGLPLEDLYLEA